ncbi:MAG TPA: riboflavin synthase, partial [Verrucomicrobiae bacterium]|nr:riboflavin synthase [Verrucomicrobiae bacterium]
LTVVEVAGNSLAFDVSPETISSSGFRSLKPGGRVNLERALRLSDRLGGHLVSGHIDAVATVTGRTLTSGNIVFTFRIAPPRAARYLVEKGSVAIDGISLTVNRVEGETFSVNVIPHTAQMTTLCETAPGGTVNIETDILARYVERLLGKPPEAGLTAEFLAKNGFM